MAYGVSHSSLVYVMHSIYHNIIYIRYNMHMKRRGWTEWSRKWIISSAKKSWFKVLDIRCEQREQSYYASSTRVAWVFTSSIRSYKKLCRLIRAQVWLDWGKYTAWWQCIMEPPLLLHKHWTTVTPFVSPAYLSLSPRPLCFLAWRNWYTRPVSKNALHNDHQKRSTSLHNRVHALFYTMHQTRAKQHLSLFLVFLYHFCHHPVISTFLYFCSSNHTRSRQHVTWLMF